MQETQHTLLDGKVHVYMRNNSRFWQCSTYLDSSNHRVSTKEENLNLAMDFAREWYTAIYVESKKIARNNRIDTLVRRYRGEDTPIENTYAHIPAPYQRATQQTEKPKRKRSGRLFAEAAEKFIAEYELSVAGERNEHYAKSHESRIRNHIISFFGDTLLNEITAGLMQEYRIKRTQNGYKGRFPSRSTLHHETVTLRLVLKTAHCYGWIEAIPDLTPPYKTSGKVKHRAWFSPEEYKMLYEATRERAKNPKQERYRTVCEDLHDYVLFMANTGLRPDEAGRLEYRDVTIVTDHDTSERILEIEVRGKRGIGYCKSMPGAVFPFQRIHERHKGKPLDKIFGKTPRLLNKVLEELDLKTDRDGNVRTAYSLRHTYICLRLMEGADIYQVAKNCRTSVEMIEKYYAIHLKNTLDASAINVRKPKRKKKKTSE
ncbi:MAG: site-specific integrase [Alphaproteobacteria bacterium]|nr:site-specific integrase [Alphaproteobacteria bacterium]